jgi:A/G-specific adenine glycosylase
VTGASVDPRSPVSELVTLGRIGSISKAAAAVGGERAGPIGDADLLGWFEVHQRRLPWRSSRDPWQILVAEAMLQQTQVARVIGRWDRFLRRFPTVSSCAAAPVGHVIDEWAGLGYNRRAVNLHRTATTIVATCGGSFPVDLDALLQLPGIGPYTARAIRVFAFELDDAVLDTNVARILARTGGESLTRSVAQRLADEAVPPGHGWAWNQALLDVGAGHCTARQPTCAGCPFAEICAWRLAGRAEPDPATGSAAVSGKQSRFAGSDRQGRGRLVAALRVAPVGGPALAATMGWPDDPERAARVAQTVVADGLAVEEQGVYRLPA